MSSSENIGDFFVNLEWNDASEKLLVSWADIAMCYTWIYERSYRRLNNLNYRYSIPIIILSTITGTLSMSLNSIIPTDYQDTVQFGLGAVNIFTGIITTLQNFFRYAQQSELNLTATTDWAKLHRNIKIELSIERHNRRPTTEFVRSTRQEYERLLNSRPIISTEIIQDFKKEFEHSDIIKPEILDKVEHTIIYQDAKIIDLYRTNVDRPKDNTQKVGIFNRIASIINSSSQSPKNSDLDFKRKRSNNLVFDSDFAELKKISIRDIRKNLKKTKKNTLEITEDSSDSLEKSPPSYQIQNDEKDNEGILNQIEKNNIEMKKILQKNNLNLNNEDTIDDFKLHLEV